jgi:hypothetical protein
MSEVSIKTTFTVTDSSDQIKGVGNYSYTIETGSYFGNVQYVTASYSAISLSGLTAVKAVYLTNTSTASISLAVHPASSSFTVMPAGASATLYPSGSLAQTFYAKATQLSASMKVVAAGP